MPAPVDIGVNLSENYTQMPELAKNGAGSASVYLFVFLSDCLSGNEFCQLAERVLPAGKISVSGWQNEFASWQNDSKTNSASWQNLFCQLAK